MDEKFLARQDIERTFAQKPDLDQVKKELTGNINNLKERMKDF